MLKHTIKTLVLISGLVPGLSMLWAQNPIYEMDVVNGTTINTCGGRFTDSSPGSTHYADNENYTVTFCSNNGSDLLAFDFGSGSNLTVERIHPSDTLFVYDGVGTSGRLLAAITGNAANSNRLDRWGGSTGGFLSLSPCVTFVFVSDAAGNEDGWEAGITCVPQSNCGGNPAASDLFSGAPFICNLDNYCGRTSDDYVDDYPGNLLGNVGGSCPVLFGGTLQNNSWLQFEASSANVSFDVSVSNCAGSGIQIAIFDYNAATQTFSRLSPCALSDGSQNGNFALTGTGLVPGQRYYIMVDGNAGAVCDYSIRAASGVSVPSAGPDQTVCNTAILNASPAPGSWSVASGSAIFADPNSPTTSVSGLGLGANVLVWTSSSGPCNTASDEVTIDNNCPPAACSFTGISLGPQTACQAANNTYTQALTVSYQNPPASGTLLINGQSFPITGSPQVITLSGLSANGAAVNLSLSFSAEPTCSLSQNNAFTAPASCSAANVCIPDNGTWD